MNDLWHYISAVKLFNSRMPILGSSKILSFRWLIGFLRGNGYPERSLLYWTIKNARVVETLSDHINSTYTGFLTK